MNPKKSGDRICLIFAFQLQETYKREKEGQDRRSQAQKARATADQQPASWWPPKSA